MSTQSGLHTMAEFWRRFSLAPLYETGFGDAVRAAAHFDDEQESIVALAYLKGYSDAARLACEYMTPSWQIANLLGCASGTFLIKIQQGELTGAMATRLVHTYTAELTELCAAKRAGRAA